jgi:urease accessory protein
MRPTQPRLLTLAVGLAAWGAAGGALAHPGHPGHETLGLWAGFAHPWSGWDHVLAMTAVGLWAALRGGRSLLLWPAAFLLAMAAGFNLGGLNASLVEAGVLASVVALGALVAANPARATITGLAVVEAAGALHGMAHAADVGHGASGFALGILIGTASLQGLGLAMGMLLRRVSGPRLLRWAGAVLAGLGLAIAAAG